MSHTEWDVFRETNTEEVWARAGKDISAISQEDAIEQVCKDFPDHLLRARYFAIPSGIYIWWVGFDEIPRSRILNIEKASTS